VFGDGVEEARGREVRFGWVQLWRVCGVENG